ncbi:MAG: hypothetical protein ABFC89_07745 [Methanospirillum sp.]
MLIAAAVGHLTAVVPMVIASLSSYTNRAVYASFVFSTAGIETPPYSYGVQPNGLFARMSSTTSVNDASVGIGVVSAPMADFTTLRETEFAIASPGTSCTVE